MAQTDWDELTNSVATTVIRRGVTSGVARPPGGAFCYGFNSLNASGGLAGLYCGLADFNPIVTGAGPTPESQGGGSIRGCIMRGTGSAKTGFSPFLYIGANVGGTASKDIAAAKAYILGLEDASPSRIVLYKGPLANGAGAVASPGTDTQVLRKSVATYNWNVWHQLRLDMVVNLGGSSSDVILRAYRSDLNAHNCDNPAWEPIVFDDALTPLMGVGCYIDDALGINTGSEPYAEGYVGFAFKATAILRSAFFDYLAISRQNVITP